MPGHALGEPCWVDAMLPDLEAGKRFYGELFGWTFGGGRAEYGHYTQAFRDGENVAALVPKRDGRMPTVWNVYFCSPDLRETGEAIRRAGGHVLIGPAEVDGFGTMMTAQDPGGAVFGVWRGKDCAGFGRKGEPGSFCRTEVLTRAPEAVDRFYGEVFGFETKRQGGAGEFDLAEWFLPGTGGEPVAGRVRMGSGFPAELPPHFVTYFAVTDCDAALETLVRLGGRVHHGPLDTPSGRYASVSDDQGAGFAVIDTSRRTGAGPS
ncbi:VOC family protein [Streptomyces thermolineatus]|uniref:VOC family protein n=1 Tax=Streptomyces thermolineatus TaxID=44033 RepID=A0ABP5ZWV2_9ACTN